ncbi:hypothetical protein ACN4EG_08925 [Alkalinema pantanalense CENA528]|uniref:hypothetical protein n=1 Tax=Alkalinema pantanalense TaxID=1620705 RepID=UPI003D6E8415
MSFSSPSNGPSPNEPSPIKPLSVGNVVSAAFRLYSAHFNQYVGIAFQATLWVVLPLLLLLVPAVYFVSMVGGRSGTAQGLGVFWLIVIAWSMGYIYCLSCYLAQAAAITRLAHSELLEKPEDPKVVQRITQSRRWSFLGSAFLLNLLILGISIVLWIGFAIFLGLIAGSGAIRLTPSGRPIMNDPALALGILLLVIGAALVWLTWVTWISARFALREVTIAVEDNVGAADSLGRSWNLTKKHAGRIILILVVAFLITLPIQVLLRVMINVVNQTIALSLPRTTPSYAIISSIIAMILGFTVSILTLPYWQIIQSVIYYDLRSRREGLGLSLRDR